MRTPHMQPLPDCEHCPRSIVYWLYCFADDHNVVRAICSFEWGFERGHRQDLWSSALGKSRAISARLFL